MPRTVSTDQARGNSTGRWLGATRARPTRKATIGARAMTTSNQRQRTRRKSDSQGASDVSAGGVRFMGSGPCGSPKELLDRSKTHEGRLLWGLPDVKNEQDGAFKVGRTHRVRPVGTRSVPTTMGGPDVKNGQDGAFKVGRTLRVRPVGTQSVPTTMGLLDVKNGQNGAFKVGRALRVRPVGTRSVPTTMGFPDVKNGQDGAFKVGRTLRVRPAGIDGHSL